MIIWCIPTYHYTTGCVCVMLDNKHKDVTPALILSVHLSIIPELTTGTMRGRGSCSSPTGKRSPAVHRALFVVAPLVLRAVRRPWFVCLQVTAGVQVRLHQPAVSAGRQDLSQRGGYHLRGRIWVPAQIFEQVWQGFLFFFVSKQGNVMHNLYHISPAQACL